MATTPAPPCWQRNQFRLHAPHHFSLHGNGHLCHYCAVRSMCCFLFYVINAFYSATTQCDRYAMINRIVVSSHLIDVDRAHMCCCALMGNTFDFGAISVGQCRWILWLVQCIRISIIIIIIIATVRCDSIHIITCQIGAAFHAFEPGKYIPSASQILTSIW